MTTKEHLERIKCKCIELLAIAEKRTAGKWGDWGMSVMARAGNSNDVSKATSVCHTYYQNQQGQPRTNDAAFIASCAGPAEAGWRATIAAIDDCLEVDQSLPLEVQKITTDMVLIANGLMVERIINAWPEELL